MARYDGYLPFNERFVSPILEGTKDVTRRFRPRHVDEILRAKIPNQRKLPSQWPGFATLQVKACSSERLQSIAEPGRVDEEVRREGASSLEAFQEIWASIYPTKPERAWDKNPAVWRIQFAVVAKGKDW